VDNFMYWVFGAAAVTCGIVLGAVFHAWWQHRAALARRRVPRQSRIVKRVLVNTREKRVWHWLVATFPEHHVMIKMPVTRFTTPEAEADREQWFALLSDVYCTFTVASPDGTAVGCVDVPGPNGIPASNLLVKRKLFSRCEVPFWVVEDGVLPASKDIFASFVPVMPVPQAQIDALEAAVSSGDLRKARAELQATVSRQRRSKTDKAAGGDENGFADSTLTPDWAPDSFQMPLDSRQGDFS
jgi:hypothetical protein